VREHGVAEGLTPGKTSFCNHSPFPAGLTAFLGRQGGPFPVSVKWGRVWGRCRRLR